MATTLMKSVRFTRVGEPADVLAVEERPLPQPEEGQTRVRILASPGNPSDLLFMRGVYSAILMLRHILAIPRGEWLLQSAAEGEL